MPRYDAVVVGAGPAGSATAAHLASGGARVLVVDRSAFPRDKACGGGLTPRGVAALDRLKISQPPEEFVRVGGLEMCADTRAVSARFPVTSRWPDYGVVTRRDILDAKVLDAAERSGAEFRSGVRALGPLMENGSCRGVRTRHNGTVEDVTAAWTIAADGATSAVARGAGSAPTVGSDEGFWYTALRAYFSGVATHDRDGLPLIEFYPLRSPDGRWLPAYGWVFPLPGGAANVGVDIPHSPHMDASPGLREAYAAFVTRLRATRPGFEHAVEDAPPVGALLPEAMRGFRPGVPGLLAVGDAAGMITPYSGEGIVYALEGAEHAAKAVLASAAPSQTVRDYAGALWDAYGFQFRWALGFMKTMRRAPFARAAATLGLRSPRVLRAAVRIMAFLIEDDPAAPASTVSRGYLGFKRAFPGHPGRAWET
jgi:geranylgeranyl reductase family protein